jgi:hypothetical protein
MNLNFNFLRKKTLRKIFLNHKGKICDKWDSYINNYEKELSFYREKPIILLEIGVQNCGSLEIWAKYFTKAKKIIGVDILKEIEDFNFNDARIKTLKWIGSSRQFLGLF